MFSDLISLLNSHSSIDAESQLLAKSCRLAYVLNMTELRAKADIGILMWEGKYWPFCDGQGHSIERLKTPLLGRSGQPFSSRRARHDLKLFSRRRRRAFREIGPAPGGA